jgi:hypothetical protein
VASRWQCRVRKQICEPCGRHVIGGTADVVVCVVVHGLCGGANGAHGRDVREIHASGGSTARVRCCCVCGRVCGRVCSCVRAGAGVGGHLLLMREWLM